MTKEEKNPLDVLHSTNELRKLILENPDYPLLVLAGEESYIDCGFQYIACTTVRAEIGEFLDCDQQIDCAKCYTDRADFEESVECWFDYFQCSNEEFKKMVKNKVSEYEPYWKKCIIVRVNN